MGPLRSFVRRLRRLIWTQDTRSWGLVAVLLVFVVHMVRYLSFHKGGGHVYSDGSYSWIFARSLAYDFDIHLANDYALCGDPFGLGTEEGGGKPANPFYFGPALYWVPIIWIAKLFVHFGPAVSAKIAGGCEGPIVFAAGLASPIASGLTVWISYRVARRWYGEIECAVAAAVIGLASPLNVFGTLTWYYSHLWAALSVALAFLAVVRAHEEPARRVRWVLAGAACALAALMRPQEGLWMLLPLASIVARARDDRANGDAAWWKNALVTAIATGAGFLVVFSVQLYVYRSLYGSPWVIPQGKLYVQLSHAHPWLLLFGARSGLLYWTPLMWLCIFGSMWLCFDKRTGALGPTIVIVAILNFYIASAALSWTGGATLGARVQTSLATPFLISAAACIAGLRRWFARRHSAGGVAVALLLLPWIWMTWAIGPAGLANNRPVPAPELYGQATTHGVSDVYKEIGNPWTLPASVVFYARYKAPPSAFDTLVSEGMFQKHYRTLAIQSADTIDFKAPPAAYWTDSLVKLEGSAVGLPAHGRGRFLVSLYWPWVTSVKIGARPLGAPATLRVRAASFWRKYDLGTVTFASKQTLEIAAPPGAFDSGINEVILETDEPIVLETWQWIDSVKRDTSVHLASKR